MDKDMVRQELKWLARQSEKSVRGAPLVRSGDLLRLTGSARRHPVILPRVAAAIVIGAAALSLFWRIEQPHLPSSAVPQSVERLVEDLYADSKEGTYLVREILPYFLSDAASPDEFMTGVWDAVGGANE